MRRAAAHASLFHQRRFTNSPLMPWLGGKPTAAGSIGGIHGSAGAFQRWFWAREAIHFRAFRIRSAHGTNSHYNRLFGLKGHPPCFSLQRQGVPAFDQVRSFFVHGREPFTNSRLLPFGYEQSNPKQQLYVKNLRPKPGWGLASRKSAPPRRLEQFQTSASV